MENDDALYLKSDCMELPKLKNKDLNFNLNLI